MFNFPTALTEQVPQLTAVLVEILAKLDPDFSYDDLGAEVWQYVRQFDDMPSFCNAYSHVIMEKLAAFIAMTFDVRLDEISYEANFQDVYFNVKGNAINSFDDLANVLGI